MYFQFLTEDKLEWAEQIGAQMSLTENISPSYRFFIQSLTKRIEKAQNGISDVSPHSADK